ncbi:ABC transporter permease [Candidatus Endowatersipora endosymbiont of Watersipora subatra]|uniref:cell division protein FtsX n=1 Tax=Candidatus Endowatersipora endosymbiont of Watersipora subatra TaxID=3077946 RepID=UPI00312CC0FD
MLLQEYKLNPIVPKESIGHLLLMITIAIMTFLASLTLTALIFVNDSAQSWKSSMTREMTIQIKPIDGVDMHMALKQAQAIATSVPGIQSARIIEDKTSKNLLKRWLGEDLSFDNVPIPRLIALTISESSILNLKEMKKKLILDVPGASLKSHKVWIDRLDSTKKITVLTGSVIFILIFLATVLTTTFATQASMIRNQKVIQALCFVGAEPAYVANLFQRRFLFLGFKGAILGSILASILPITLNLFFSDVAIQIFYNFWNFGDLFNLDLIRCMSELMLIVVIVLLTSMTSRLTVIKDINLRPIKKNRYGR